MSRTIALNCSWSGGLVYIRPGMSVLVPVSALDASNRYYKIESLSGTLYVHAFSSTDEEYGSVTTYHYDGAYASLGASTGVSTAGTIIPEYDEYGEVELTGTVQFLTFGPSELIWRILHGTAVVSGNIDATNLTLMLTLSDEKAGLTPVCNPTSGHVDPTVGTLLQWSFSDVYASYTMPTQSSAVVSWQVIGDDTVHTINAGTAQSVTIPANSFAQGDQIRWKVKVTANTGVENESQWMTLITTDGPAVAVPISPINEIVDGSLPVLFRWRHSTVYGTAQTGAKIGLSPDGDTWNHDITLDDGYAQQEYEAPASVVSQAVAENGTVYWRIKTKNADGFWGEWSSAVQFVLVAAPAPPNVTVDEVPMAVVRWTSSGQEGYQVQVAGYDTGPMYGADQSWAVPDPLPDGSYTARVRVVNTFGLWSEWAEWAFVIANSAGSAITLQGTGGDSAILTWTVPDLINVSKSSGTNRGITYTWSANDNAFTINGTADADVSPSIRTIRGGNDIPDWLKKGCRYRFRWSGCETSGVHFGFTLYRGSGSTYLGTVWLDHNQTDGILELPDKMSGYTVTGIRIALMVEPGVTVNNAVVSVEDVRQVYDRYAVHRDGERIAETTGQTYQDSLAGVGMHSYMVRGLMPTLGYYTDSNSISLNISLNTVEIQNPATGETLVIPMALAGDVHVDGTRSRAVVLQHWNGSGLPSAEIGDAEELALTLRPSFPTAYFGLANSLERLLGAVIHYRDPYGHSLWGVMNEMGYERTPIRRTYDLTIREVDYDPA